MVQQPSFCQPASVHDLTDAYEQLWSEAGSRPRRDPAGLVEAGDAYLQFWDASERPFTKATAGDGANPGQHAAAGA